MWYRFFRGLAVIATTSILAILAPYVLASEGSPWLDDSLTLNSLGVINPDKPIPYSINGNRDCINQKIITRPDRSILGFTHQEEQRHTSCVVETAFGTVTTDSLLQRQGTEVAGPVFLPSGVKANLIPIPRSNTVIRYYNGPNNTLFFQFFDEFSDVLQTTVFGDKAVKHTIAATPTTTLKDKAGNPLAVQTDSLSFSSDGTWMVVDVPFKGIIRVNLNTFEVLPFAPTFNYNIGLAPNAQTAITSDGRYAVIASGSFSRFELYDLGTCGSVPNTFNAPVSCRSRTLVTFLGQEIPGYTGSGTIRFTGNTLHFYASRTEGSHKETDEYTLRPSSVEVALFEYLALGDSFASGEGAYQYKTHTDTDDNKCHVSLRSYPYIIASGMGLNTYESVACSGAMILNIDDTDKDHRGQVDKVRRSDRSSNNIAEILNQFSSGYLSQHEFVETHRPSVITLSAVGNDIGFSDKLRRCLEPDTCFETYEDRKEILLEINSHFDRIVGMYSQLKGTGHPHAKLYAIGYPQLAKADGNCALNVHLSNEEIKFSNQLVTYLNDTIELAAQKAGIAYVDVELALAEARLCETESYDVAVNGLTAGNDTVDLLNGPIGNESYHPNAFGHELLAAAIRNKTSDFSLTMSAPNPGAIPVNPDDSLEILDAPKSGRTLNYLNFDTDRENNILYRNGAWGAAYRANDFALKPLSAAKAWLNSDPVLLGEFTTDAKGNLTVGGNVPATVPTGFHTLHIYAQTVADEPVDIYKTVYIADSPEDLDGDGIVNSDEPCNIVEVSGIDVDQDGIDDSCDALIGRAPPVIPVVSSVPADESQLSNSEGNTTAQGTSEITPTSNPQTTAAPANEQHLSNSLTADNRIVLGDSTSSATKITDPLDHTAIQSDSSSNKVAELGNNRTIWFVGGLLIVVGTVTLAVAKRQ